VYQYTETARKRSVQTGDWGFLVDWIVFFSINLGVINLLPIPVLDGGHIAISVTEGIRRKKLAAKTRRILNTIGLVAVLGIFALAIVSDTVRLAGF
jgi:regulator of sigma E protease